MFLINFNKLMLNIRYSFGWTLSLQKFHIIRSNKHSRFTAFEILKHCTDIFVSLNVKF